ncbi:alpha-rhamnosidase [Mucilaginibacter conchicola]|uniref:Alpha-rhamnosidase n=1 Tax=Mucilaginibacter conchicola TaxID=2303333 RepID=A0A372NTI0_9SPHI|nr:alpha-L-rhamnosidase N-terminal domain-containing protein [Mucilaginibacter conchicola]RFZ92211.1 alpha-rhamnosidase [Mucilaginibacter conchicola]
MKLPARLVLALLCLVALSPLKAQNINPDLLTKKWKAHWIFLPNEPDKTYGVYHFRKSFDLPTKPAKFVVHVSADNRYKLYVNGKLVSLGPARGDTYYWNYETVDIAPYLEAGKNTIASLVWNDGEDRPEAQITEWTAFILQGDTEKEDIINTDKTWRGIRDNAFKPLTGVGYPTYYVAGPGEMVDMHQMVKDWQSAGFNDNAWLPAKELDRGQPKGMTDAFGWMLVPSSIPQMEMTNQRINTLRYAKGFTAPTGFPATQTAVTIPANTTASMLLDQTFLTNAYLTLNLSGGDKAGISFTYCESPMANTRGMVKPNRNEVDGYKFAGRKDSIIADGSAGQVFTTMAFRTYKYILVNITTHEQPLTINDIYGTFTGFPFKRQAKLEVADPEMQQILDIGWRTARLCAVETYFDCPYYEQLQYIGDGRIQAMVSYYNAGDDRLARNAINLIDHSRIAEGVTLSRHPSFSPQIISTFSLWYVGMLHDYWMYRNDPKFVKDKLEGVRQVLAFFSKYQQADGSLKKTPYWTFVDWVSTQGWDFGQSPKDKDGNSSVLDMQLLWAYQQAAEMESKLGMPAFATMYNAKASQLKTAIQKKYWDAGRGLYADNKDKNTWSQHANSLAILSGVAQGANVPAIAKRLQNDTTIVSSTIYFKYYVHQAMVKGGLGNNYVKWLDIWRNNIKTGLTTWAEISDLEHNRSDCHAWGASPNIEFFRTVLGVDSYAPGFSKVKVEPHLGSLQNAAGEVPHPNGMVKVNYRKTGAKWAMDVELPMRTDGVFIWKGKSYYLKGGKNSLGI